MYAGSGSVSGIIHLVAKRPYIASIIATVGVTLALVQPPAPPAPLPPPAPKVELAVVVEKPAPLAPASTNPCAIDVTGSPKQLGNCYFNYSAPPHGKDGLAARADKVCKTTLDGTILYLKEHNNDIVLEGNSLSGHGSIALSRARSVKRYLVQNGIDPNRIKIVRGVKHQRLVDLVAVPSGASSIPTPTVQRVVKRHVKPVYQEK